jgi:hypothetical protein
MASKNKIPDPLVPREFLGGLYHPEFVPEKLDIANFLIEIDSQEEVQKSLKAKQFGTPVTGARGLSSQKDTPIPLTEAEAVEADKQIQATLDRIQFMKNKIAALKRDVDSQVEPNDASGKKKEWKFKLDITKKHRIRRAVKKLFGVKTDTITYGMYKKMLAAKAQLEEEQGDGYLRGFPKKGGGKKNDKKESKSTNNKNKKDGGGGFLERSSKKEDGEEVSSQDEEHYLRMFPKIGRDFVYQGDFNNQIQGIMSLLNPAGTSSVAADTSEARKRAREYKAVLDSGEDGTKKYKDLIKLDDD